MKDKGVCRTAPATPGLLNKDVLNYGKILLLSFVLLIRLPAFIGDPFYGPFV